MPRPPEPLCPCCRRPYPYGDPRSVIAPPLPCFDCEQGDRNKRAITEADIAVARAFLRQYERIERHGQPNDPAGHLQLQMGIGRARAERLVHAARQGVTTAELRKRQRRRRGGL